MAGWAGRTELIRVSADRPDNSLLLPAAQALQRGDLVAFPTETVYGLGANALDPAAVARIFAVKGRPADNPLIIHAPDLAALEPFVTRLSPLAVCLIEHFSPGPLTLVLPKSAAVPDIVTAGLDTVAVRIPAHTVALALLRLAKHAVAAPSANRSGSPSPTRVWHVSQDLDGLIPYIVDGGPCQYGLESTVLDLSGERPLILRPGSITAAEIEAACGTRPVLHEASGSAPRSPGMKYRHYSPKARLVLAGQNTGQPLVELVQELQQNGARIGLYASRQAAKPLLASCQDLAGLDRLGTRQLAPGSCSLIAYADLPDPVLAAKTLFAALRSFDAAGCDVIIVESLPETGVGLAYMNRVRKAAQPDS